MTNAALLTGRQLAVALANRFHGRDWVAELADLAGASRDFVEWHLQEDMLPPTEIMRAADALEKEPACKPSDGEAEGKHLSRTGLPGNMRRLRTD
jgi:hypothetical protein